MDDILFRYFIEHLRDNTKIITLKSICQRFKPSNPRYEDHPLHYFEYPWKTLNAPPDSVSWTSKPVSYYIYVLNRAQVGDAKKLSTKLAPAKPKHPGLGARN